MNIRTAKETFECIKNDTDPFPLSYWNKEFLDGICLHINRYEGDIRDLFKDKPFELDEVEGDQILELEAALISGLTEELFEMYDILDDLPEWFFTSSFSLSEPTFGTKSEVVKAIKKKETPCYYAKRGLYCGKIIGGPLETELRKSIRGVSEVRQTMQR
ncbi:hypothetical protein [Thiomicrorhabdus sp. Milos-T2]|uniref:hypothetical protein n=1 Tax=Thiomicrorhabdus sp. Milos-T2 TaxID=90814 RepID=UPI0004948201|nr:hypothetical protein [Thiomicrorhabdus sp. Milos-T2]